MTEAKHDVPSGYSGLNTADVLPGSRSKKYVELLWTTDPLAEAVMDEFARMPESEWRALLDLALAKGVDAVPHVPESLRALFHQLESVPFWVDRDRCNLGGATFLRCRMGFAAPQRYDAIRVRRLSARWPGPVFGRVCDDRACAPHPCASAEIAPRLRSMAPGSLGSTHQSVPHGWHQRHVFRWRARRFNAVRLPLRACGTGGSRPCMALRRILAGRRS